MLTIKPLHQDDVGGITAAFASLGWKRPPDQYRGYLTEAERGTRVSLVARLDTVFAGYGTLLWASGYPPFREAGIPEISDLNVLPQFRRRGIGTELLRQLEAVAGGRSSTMGIAVGLTADYAPALRLYVSRGYHPDGRGASHNGTAIKWGDRVTVDDSLVMHLLRPGA